MIDQIIAFNKTFVAQKGYEQYLTDKYPDKKLAVAAARRARTEKRRRENHQERRWAGDFRLRLGDA